MADCICEDWCVVRWPGFPKNLKRRMGGVYVFCDVSGTRSAVGESLEFAIGARYGQWKIPSL
jgi:hypothetical protein